MKNKWIKKGEKVRVISGNDKGRVGEVLSRTEQHVVVQGVNVRKRHMKSREQGRKSEIVSREMAVHISNVALCNSDGNKLKLKVKKGDDKSKALVFVAEGKEENYRILSPPSK